jgi:phosphoribosylanthranilate isomerase
MNLWVKICGNTSVEDALLAAEAGADALGFIFAPSPRHVTAVQVASITPQLPAAIEKIGVFVDADFATIAETVELAGLTGVQLHSGGDSGLPQQLRERFGPAMRILRVIHFGEDAASQLEAVSGDQHIDGVLVDSRTATALGGTGISFDWEAARSSIFTGDSGLKLIAAGGLNPDNVAEAINTLRPWGVDAVSGVERAPGRKHADKVRAFIANARAATAPL